jgi:hypothetical protein
MLVNVDEGNNKGCDDVLDMEKIIIDTVNINKDTIIINIAE